MNIKLKEFCLNAIKDLENSNRWAETFVLNRMALQREFLKGKILSTSHGADIFTNILDCLNGTEWEEKGGLGQNFRLFIQENLT